jgi:hypothetical protein
MDDNLIMFGVKYPLRLRDCEYYEECLDNAAFKNKPKFTCENCKKYSPVVIDKDIP